MPPDAPGYQIKILSIFARGFIFAPEWQKVSKYQCKMGMKSLPRGGGFIPSISSALNPNQLRPNHPF